MMTTSEQLYSALGHLSVAFAETEQNMRDLLSIHIGKGDASLIGQHLVEDMPLFRLLELTKKVVRVGSPRQRGMTSIIKSIEALRPERNRFIHGKWKVSKRAVEGEPIAWYTSDRIVFSEGVRNGEKVLSWMTSKTERIPLSRIRAITEKLIGIIELQEALLNDLKELDNHEWD